MFQRKLQAKSQLVLKRLVACMYISVDSSEQDYIVFHIQIKITT